jgi:hypothetical protein
LGRRYYRHDYIENIKLSVSRTHHKSSFLRAPTEHN